MGEAILSEIITLLYSGIEQSAEGLAAGVEALTEGLFVVATTTDSGTTYSLTTFGVLVVVFAGIALTIGLSKLIFKWLMSLGARN